MRKFLVLFLLLFTVNAFSQSGRVSAENSQTASIEAQKNDVTAKELFDEANVYAKTKFAEFEAQKKPFTDKLYEQVLRERKQLAAKYAATVSSRKDAAGEDFYYLAMLHWIAENLDGM
nr:hypothetical protein [Pyrinomonadaceae bacterium]